MHKRIFQILVVFMILGLLASAMAPFLLSSGSLKSSDAAGQEETNN